MLSAVCLLTHYVYPVGATVHICRGDYRVSGRTSVVPVLSLSWEPGLCSEALPWHPVAEQEESSLDQSGRSQPFCSHCLLSEPGCPHLGTAPPQLQGVSDSYRKCEHTEASRSGFWLLAILLGGGSCHPPAFLSSLALRGGVGTPTPTGHWSLGCASYFPTPVP